MDYDGQGRAELWSQLIILSCTVIGAVWAFISQQFSLAFFSHLAGFVVACILCLPPWPIFRRKPLKWQPSIRPPVVEPSKKTFIGTIREWYFVYETRLSINLLEPWEKVVLNTLVLGSINAILYFTWTYAKDFIAWPVLAVPSSVR